ncbi:DMT family transporter [Lautropia dentalis]|jgi:putative membrane protein|uniref:DMT family transporter n=1 Tax=Lautropia dentalis TaxID=2490857 RepID=A0A426FNX9_9BURK|nr:DMT family transporter [Lautropia dentalis]RRN44371.1 DMT family transporter [Lautropia dentalis]
MPSSRLDTSPATSPRRALIIAHVAAVLFGMTGILGALIHFAPTTITAGRAGFAAVSLLVLALLQRRPVVRALNVRHIRVLLASGIFLAVHWVTFFLAVKVGGVAVATLGFASFPAFIALLDVLVFRERIGAGEGTLLTLVTLGLILVTPSFDFGNSGTIGLLWGLLSGLSFACLAVLNRRGSRGVDAIQVALWQNTIVFLLVLPLAGAMGGMEAGDVSTMQEAAVHVAGSAQKEAAGHTAGSTQVARSTHAVDAAGSVVATPSHLADWFWLAVLGIFCTGLSHTLFVRSLDGLDARSAGMIIALEPVYAIACAWWLFGDQPSLRMLAGAGLIILATVLSARGNKG